MLSVDFFEKLLYQEEQKWLENQMTNARENVDVLEESLLFDHEHRKTPTTQPLVIENQQLHSIFSISDQHRLNSPEPIKCQQDSIVMKLSTAVESLPEISQHVSSQPAVISAAAIWGEYSDVERRSSDRSRDCSVSTDSDSEFGLSEYSYTSGIDISDIPSKLLGTEDEGIGIRSDSDSDNNQFSSSNSPVSLPHFHHSFNMNVKSRNKYNYMQNEKLSCYEYLNKNLVDNSISSECTDDYNGSELQIKSHRNLLKHNENNGNSEQLVSNENNDDSHNKTNDQSSCDSVIDSNQEFQKSPDLKQLNVCEKSILSSLPMSSLKKYCDPSTSVQPALSINMDNTMNSLITSSLHNDKISSSNSILDNNNRADSKINNSNSEDLLNSNIHSEQSYQTSVSLLSPFTNTYNAVQIKPLRKLTSIISFYLPLGIIERNMIDSNDSIFVCHHCLKKLKTVAAYISHMINHGELIRYICLLCKKYTEHRSEIDQHINKHGGQWPFKCHLCKKSYRNRYGLTRHFKSNHSSDHNNDLSGITIKKLDIIHRPSTEIL